MKQPIPFGKYYLMDLIAKGGMAEVFKAKYLGPEGFSKVVAVKRILPELAEEQEFIQMFIDEAKIASQLSHANISQILQLGEEQGSYFIAMEFVQGKDIRTLYERSRRDDGVPISPQMAAFILAAVCDGIDYAHRRCDQKGNHLGIIHRDVSPQNIIASFDGDVKLIDFGIAKAQDKLVKTEAGILKGKYCYMSPEQVKGATIDHRSDIFGLGVVLHEILTRQRLFLGSNDLNTLRNVLDKEIPVPSSINPSIPPALDAIVMRALSRNVSLRYQYASEMREDLMRFLYSFPSVFGRRDLAAYMHQVFKTDLEREMRRLLAYEPFFEALPNTPRPSSVEQFSQHSPRSTHDFVPPTQALQESVQGQEFLQSGALLEQEVSSYQHSIQQNDVTSYSGPHPYPNGLSQAEPATALHGTAGQQFYQKQSSAPQQSHSFQAAPTVAPPSFIYQQEEDDFDDDDELTIHNVPEKKESATPPPPPPFFGKKDEDIPTKQLDWPGSASLPSDLSLPQTALLQTSQFVENVPLQENDYLQPMPSVPTAPLSASRPSAFAPDKEPPKPPQEVHDYFDELDDGGSETMVQPTIQHEVLSPSSSSLRAWAMGLGMVVLVLSIGLIGAYFYRCQLFKVCEPQHEAKPSGIYTFVFSKPVSGVQIYRNGMLFPLGQMKTISPRRIQLTFYKEGSFVLELRKAGCKTLKNRVRISFAMEMETPTLQMKCSTSVPRIPKASTKSQSRLKKRGHRR